MFCFTWRSHCRRIAIPRSCRASTPGRHRRRGAAGASGRKQSVCVLVVCLSLFEFDVWLSLLCVLLFSSGGRKNTPARPPAPPARPCGRRSLGQRLTRSRAGERDKVLLQRVVDSGGRAPTGGGVSCLRKVSGETHAYRVV